MSKIRARFRTSFGDLELEARSAEGLLEALQNLPEDFVNKVCAVLASKSSSAKEGLEGIVELTTEGPVVTTRVKLSHYEAIGLIVYASDKKTSTAAKIGDLLKSSGIKVMVPARINEMTKRGLVFKPDPSRPEFKLTVQGEKWVDDLVLRLRGQKD